MSTDRLLPVRSAISFPDAEENLLAIHHGGSSDSAEIAIFLCEFFPKLFTCFGHARKMGIVYKTLIRSRKGTRK